MHTFIGKHTKQLPAIALAVLLTAFLFNEPLRALLGLFQGVWWETSMMWAAGVLCPMVMMLFLLWVGTLAKNFGTESRVLLLTTALGAAVASLWIKELFHFSRPPIDENTLLILSTPGFVSTQTAMAWSFLPILHFYKKRWVPLATVFGIFVIISSLAAGIHYFSDLIGGALLGLSIGHLLLTLQFHSAYFTQLAHSFERELEYRRQCAHLLTGIIIAACLATHLFTAWHLLALLVLGSIAIIQIKQGKFSLLRRILCFFERDHHLKRFPGRGVFYFFLGAFLVSLFFPTVIAVGSVLILGIGDSLTNIIGRDYGKRPLPYNPKKNIEGPLISALIAGIALSSFLPLPAALLASLAAMFVESLPLRIGNFEIDDNVTIPLTAAIVLSLLL